MRMPVEEMCRGDEMAAGRQEGLHRNIHRLDVGTHGEEFVDRTEPATKRRNVERGFAILW
jgi:hypothetical protein